MAMVSSLDDVVPGGEKDRRYAAVLGWIGYVVGTAWLYRKALGQKLCFPQVTRSGPWNRCDCLANFLTSKIMNNGLDVADVARFRVQKENGSGRGECGSLRRSKRTTRREGSNQ